MHIQLHKNARTSPAIRQEIQSSNLSNTELAETYNLNLHTVRKWRNRTSLFDASHRPHNLHATLSDRQEAIVVILRKDLLLPLDDLLAVVHEFIHSTLSPICLRSNA